MPQSPSNRYSILSEDASDPVDVRLGMEDLQGANPETEETHMSKVSYVSASNSMTYLIAFGL